ncbi:hypothetical protein PJM52_29340, partial [Mycobacterium kansasii]
DRLKRDKPTHSNVFFNVENSINQQSMYVKLQADLKRYCPEVNTITINSAIQCPEDIVYDIIQGSF